MKILRTPKRSAMHNAVKALLVSLYPNFLLKEEMPVETASGNLPCDLCVPSMKLCVECHGVQHYQFTPHFHQTPDDYTAQKTRDRHKKEAIRRAGWAYVAIRYDEYEKLTENKLAKKILKALKEKD